MMNGTLLVGLAAGTLAVGVAFGGDYDEAHGYVQLVSSPTSGEVTAFNAPDGNDFWSDHLAPHSTTNYFIPSSGKITTLYTPKNPGSPIRWNGGKLVVGGTFWHVSNQDTTVDDLVVLGYKKSFYVAGQPGPLSGTMTVLGTVDNPSTFGHSASAQLMEMKVRMVGDENAVFRCALKNAGGGFRFSGDCSGYLGTLIFDRTNPEINNEDAPTPSTAPCGYTLATSFPGTLKVCGETRFNVTNDATVGTLDLGAETTLVYGNVGPASGSCLTVTGLLTVTGRPKVLVSSLVTGFADAYSRPLLKFGAESDVTIDDFDITVKSATEPLGVHDYVFEVGEAEDGVRELRVVKTRTSVNVVRINTSAANAYGYSAFSTAQDANGAFYWDDENVPGEGNTYVANYAKSSKFHLPPNGASADIYSFPGEALYLKNVGFTAASSTSANKGGGISANRLYWHSGEISVWSNQGTRDKTIDSDISWFRFCGGKIYTYEGGIISSISYNDQGLMFESEVIGGGLFDFKVTNASKSSGRRAHFIFTQANTNFTGRICVSARDSEDNPAICSGDGLPSPSDVSCQTLYVTNGLSLGGACKSFVYDGLTLERYARLVVRNHDVELPGGLNRGVFINGIGRFVVEPNLTLTVGRPITVNGRFRKEGTGTLALGGELFFTDGVAETLPEEDKNLVTVEQGDLKVLSADALNGAAITFFANTRLVVPADAKDADLRTYGLRNTKGTFAASRLALADGAGTLPVLLDAEGSLMPSECEYQIGLVTLPTEAEVRALLTKVQLAARRPYKGFAAALAVRENADGTWTLVADITRTGLMMVIR